MKKVVLGIVLICLAAGFTTTIVGLPQTLNQIDAQVLAMKQAEADFFAARAAHKAARQLIESALAPGGPVDMDIREANVSGLGNVITAGFLDTVTVGNVIDFEFENDNRRLSFTYELTADTNYIRDINYFNKVRSKIQ